MKRSCEVLGVRASESGTRWELITDEHSVTGLSEIEVAIVLLQSLGSPRK